MSNQSFEARADEWLRNFYLPYYGIGNATEKRSDVDNLAAEFRKVSEDAKTEQREADAKIAEERQPRMDYTEALIGEDIAAAIREQEQT